MKKAEQKLETVTKENEDLKDGVETFESRSDYNLRRADQDDFKARCDRSILLLNPCAQRKCSPRAALKPHLSA